MILKIQRIMGLFHTFPVVPTKIIHKSLIFQRLFLLSIPQNGGFSVFCTSVTVGCDSMALKYNHLERRNHTYYFRYWIPSWVRQFFDKTCIRYSLNTNDYNIAVHLVKRETFKYDMLLNDIRWIVMEIRNGKLEL